MALTKIDDRGLKTPIDLIDNEKIRLGTGNDLQIYHDGTNSTITNGTGYLVVESTSGNLYLDGSDINLRVGSQGSEESAIVCTNNGAVELYHNNVLQLFTKSTGAEVTTTGAVANFVVRGKEGYGASLTLASDDGDDPGDYARILQHTDEALYFQVYNAANSAYEDAIIAKHDGAVELYYDDNKKFETHSSGSTINGYLNFTNANTAIWLTDDQSLRLGTGQDLKIYHDGTHSYIDNGTGNIKIRSTGTELGAVFVANGEAKLYYDNSKKFETYSGGCTFQGNIKADQDNATLVLGAGSDLQMWHDGSNSKIINTTGYLQLQTTSGSLYLDGNNTYIRSGDGGEYQAKFIDDGAAELYDNGSKKFATTSTGVKITGIVHVDDSDKLVCGTGQDLQIYHNGSASYIDNTGDLFIQGDAILLEAENGENYFKGEANGAAKLYYDNVKKLETTSFGTSSTGYFSIAGSGTRYGYTGGDNVLISLGDSNDLQMFHDGSNSYIKDNGIGFLILQSNQLQIKNDLADEKMLLADANGATELYYDGSRKFLTTSTGVQIEGMMHAHRAISDSAYTSSNWHVLSSDKNSSVATVIEHSGDSTPYGLFIGFSDAAPDDHTKYFIDCGDSSTTRMTVYSDGDIWTSDSSYLSSDETLKENITDATPKLEDLKKLKVRNFNWKSSFHPEKSKKKQLGFIAQEVEEIFPALITEHDISSRSPDNSHTPVMKKAIKAAWDPIIIKAMQELIAKVETLETKVAALEAK